MNFEVGGVSIPRLPNIEWKRLSKPNFRLVQKKNSTVSGVLQRASKSRFPADNRFLDSCLRTVRAGGMAFDVKQAMVDGIMSAPPLSLDAQRSVHQGVLQKRCRLCWRPRYVELISDPADYPGSLHSYQLLIFHPSKRVLKDRIRMEDIVTIRANRDCYFQIFLSSGKILQFKAQTMESQACWMAMLKVGLGRGCIFHVRVNTPLTSLEHTLLYSIGVNLPAHRVGQLDRVLVLASPVNDINILAWDLNRVKRFIELDIGIRMELCSGCIPHGQNTTITFIIEKNFIRDCMSFLCQEARIPNIPQTQDGLMVYNLSHQCGYCTPPSVQPPPPPPYEPPTADGEKQLLEGGRQSPTLAPPKLPPKPPLVPAFEFSDQWWEDSFSGGSGPSSLTQKEKCDERIGDLPPRSIPRKNHEVSIPAMPQPYLNFQPHLFNRRHFEAPYQISSRIIITDSGEVQFERSILGNMQQAHGGFHINKQMPLPPRTRAKTGFSQLPPRTLNVPPSTEGHSSFTSTPPKVPYKQRRGCPPPLHRMNSDSQLQETFSSRLQRRASDVSQGENGEYIIPTLSETSSEPPQPTSSTSYNPYFNGSYSEEDSKGNNTSESTGHIPPSDNLEDYDDIISVRVTTRTVQSQSSSLGKAPIPSPRTKKPQVTPRKSRSKSNASENSYTSQKNSTQCGSPVWDHKHVTVYPEKIATRGDDQAGLLDQDLITNSGFDYPTRRVSDEMPGTTYVHVSPILKRPKPKPRSRTVVGTCAVQVNVDIKHSDVGDSKHLTSSAEDIPRRDPNMSTHYININNMPVTDV